MEVRQKGSHELHPNSYREAERVAEVIYNVMVGPRETIEGTPV